MERKEMEKLAIKKLQPPAIKNKLLYLENLLDRFASGDDATVLKETYSEYKQLSNMQVTKPINWDIIYRALDWLGAIKTVTATVTETMSSKIIKNSIVQEKKYTIEDLGTSFGLLALKNECFKWENYENVSYELCWFKSLKSQHSIIGTNRIVIL